jgi:hypothetical protein
MLSNIDLELRVRVIVTPIPIGLLIPNFELREVPILAMIFLRPHAVCPVFMIILCVIVIVFRVVIALVIRTHHARRQDQRRN